MAPKMNQNGPNMIPVWFEMDPKWFENNLQVASGPPNGGDMPACNGIGRGERPPGASREDLLGAL